MGTTSDHSRTNEEHGRAAVHARFCRTLKQYGLGQALGVAPNHMTILGLREIIAT